MSKLRILITGGAGFIGTNAVARYVKRDCDVVVLDNLSRKGSEINLRWLREQGKFKFIKANVEDETLKQTLFQKMSFDIVLHLAAQVAITSSVINPMHDFNINAYGTLLLLEAVRQTSPDSVFIYASTNKVYGSLRELKLHEEAKRYYFDNRQRGITENQPLDFHSPYSCSKGCGDQYVRDYARIYDMKTVVMRQSCIYGPHQFGIEDQGWIAWFIIACLSCKPISVYGNGKQVRDVLHIADLLDCYDSAVKNIEVVKGKIYNIGGGPLNQLSVLELLDLLSTMSGKDVKYRHYEERPGDQKMYVSDISKAQTELGWSPHIQSKDGIQQLYNWIKESFLC